MAAQSKPCVRAPGAAGCRKAGRRRLICVASLGGWYHRAMRTNRQWVLGKRPKGMVAETNFRLVEGPAPEPQDGEALVRNLYLSMDPTQRGWMSRDTYLPVVRLLEVMRSFAVGRVVESKNPAYAPGDLISGLFGWQDWAIVKADQQVLRVPQGAPIPQSMSAAGVTGLTAYYGLLEIGQPKPGDTVVVSGAAGATGSVVGQLARLKGCRAIGIAGGPEKCEWLVKQARFEAAIDYKSEDVGERLRALCPKGIDVYFDNVGGAILDHALASLAMHGRVVLCGAIATYNDDALTGPKNYLALLLKRARMEGFIILDYIPRAGPALEQLTAWLKAGELVDRVDVMEGFENAPKALVRLFAGQNQGKQLLKIAD